MAELAPGVDHDPDKQGGEPCVAGTRIPVRLVGHLVDRHETDPAAPADRYGIPLSDVHRALAYYYDHPDEMEEYDQRDRTLERRADGTVEAETLEEARRRLENDS